MGLSSIAKIHARWRRAAWNALRTVIYRLWVARLRRGTAARARAVVATARSAGEFIEPDPATLAAHIRKWSRLGHKVSPHPYRRYKAFGRADDVDFVPDDLYYSVIEPTLNNYHVGLAYSDKNMYEALFEAGDFPESILRNVDGCYYDSRYRIIRETGIDTLLEPYDRLVVKPSIGVGGGDKVRVFIRQGDAFRSSDGLLLDAPSLAAAYGGNFVVQKYFEQHDYFRNLNPSSVNGFRLFTYRSVADDAVHVLGARLKVGGPNSEIDNWTNGGVFCGLDLNGQPGKMALTEHMRWVDTLPASGLPVASLGPVPAFAEACEVARRTAPLLRYSRLLGFDMCVDRNGCPRIMEINNRYIGILPHQATGGPLFREFTDEIIEYCVENARRSAGIFI